MDTLSGKPHFPPLEGPLDGYPTINPHRRLQPLRKAPQMVPLPIPLPASISRNGAFSRTYTVSVHILPAAFPRAPSIYGDVKVPSATAFAGKGLDPKQARKKWLKDTTERMLWEKGEACRPFPDPKTGVKVGEYGLWNTVTRIRRNNDTKSKEKNGKKPITLIATHASGFHKEVKTL